MMKLTLFLSLLSAAAALGAQTSAPPNWFNLDSSKDGVAGVGTERAYDELLEGKESETVVVAIIDSGVDPTHEDLADIMWTNPGEVPDNGKDDDGNGYVDDVHGWNFIGGRDGTNVGPDTYEATRVYAKLRDRFEGVDSTKLRGRDKADFERYQETRNLVLSKRATMGRNLEQYQGLLQGVEVLQGKLGEDFTSADLAAYTGENEMEEMLIGILGRVLGSGQTASEVHAELEGAVEYFGNSYNYGWNPDFNTREIVGDDYADVNERGYGNNDVQGPDATHGTHVAGIIGAVRGNGKGMDGVADNVRIMSVRAVPDGDERDKDVANAIRYAVDNGAKVINMSFGKGYSWDKDAVDRAVKYAAKKDVLLVHAAGNSNEDTDDAANFPTRAYERKGFFKFLKKRYPNNWLEIGALSWKPGEDAVATFSNYGQHSVDIFSPGVDIYSTTPDQGYENLSGTSMASPVTAGVAALLRSYFPDLSAKDVKEVILESGTSQAGRKVKLPGSDTLVPFDTLSTTGKVVNAYGAVKLATARSKGRKGKGSGKKSDSRA